MKNDLHIKDITIKESFNKNGFVKVQLLDNEGISQLLAIYNDLLSKNELPQVYNCLVHTKPEVKVEIHRRIKEISKPYLDKFFGNYKIAVSHFFVISPSKKFEEKLGVHQDPTLLIDEHENHNIKVWCPLTDTNSNNSMLQVIRGSHLFFPPVQAITIPTPFSLLGDINYLHECIPVKAGEVVFFDSRLIHSSMPNFSTEKRISVTMSAVSSGAKYISLYREQTANNPGIEIYSQEENWHYHPLWDNTLEPPKIGRKIGYLDYEVFYVSKEGFLDLIKNPRPYKKYTYKIIAQKKQNVFSKLKSLF